MKGGFTFCCVSPVVSKIAKTAIRWLSPIKACTGLNNNLYQCLKSIYSYKMGFLLLATSPYKMSLHTLLSFFMFNNSNLSLQKGSNNKLNGLIEWVGPSKLLLQNVQLCLLGVLLQNAPVRGLFVTGNYKMPMYTYLYINLRGPTPSKSEGKFQRWCIYLFNLLACLLAVCWLPLTGLQHQRWIFPAITRWPAPKHLRMPGLISNGQI